MAAQECTVANLALIFQYIIIAISLVFSLATVIMIIRNKQYANPFTFLILMVQLCYATMAVIDLTTKTTTSSNAHFTWCKVMGPIIYSAITSSFVLIELFVVMIYKTISRQVHGWINKNVKLLSVGLIVVTICINCVGIPFYGLGFCNSCQFIHSGYSAYQQFVNVVIQADYYLPMGLILPTLYYIYKLVQMRKTNLMDKKQSLAFRVLSIPILNFIILTMCGIFTFLPMSAQNAISPVAYVFVFESIYFVSIVNFVFYCLFVSFFGIDDDDTLNQKGCCDCDCWTSGGSTRRQSELVFSDFQRKDSS